MKLASYTVGGKAAFGVVVGDGVVDVTRRLSGKFASLRQAFTRGMPASAAR